MLRTSLVFVGLAVALAFEGQAAAGGAGIIVPPARVDVGTLIPLIGGEAVEPGTEVLIGLHWSSIAWKPTHFDFGVGFISSYRPLVANRRSAIARSTGTTTQPLDDTLQITGGYLSLGKTLVNQKNFRTWIEARGELLHGSLDAHRFSASGGAVRFAAEIFSSGAAGFASSNAIGVFAGTLSVGVYLEASHRDIALELGPTGLAGGVTIRVPFILAGVG